MSKFNYNGPDEFEPIGAWGYFGYSILYSIPIIGFIILIVHAISSYNINRRSYARSYFCGFILILVLVIVIFALGGASYLEEFLKNYQDALI